MAVYINKPLFEEGSFDKKVNGSSKKSFLKSTNITHNIFSKGSISTILSIVVAIIFMAYTFNFYFANGGYVPSRLSSFSSWQSFQPEFTFSELYPDLVETTNSVPFRDIHNAFTSPFVNTDWGLLNPLREFINGIAGVLGFAWSAITGLVEIITEFILIVF